MKTNGTKANGLKANDDPAAEFVSAIHSGAKTDRLFREAVRDALREHKRRGESVVVWQDGKVVTLAPQDIPVDESAA